MRYAGLSLSAIAVISLTACGSTVGGKVGHLLSNGAQDSVVDEQDQPPTDLVGLSNQSVVDRLGTPDIARYEGDVLYWRYSTANCLLDVYLSVDDQTGELAVKHLTVRGRHGFASFGLCPTVPVEQAIPEL